MTDMVVSSVFETADYNSIIHKAFIEPIRTVSIIDDDYPSLDLMLKDLNAEQKNKWNPQDIFRLQSMLGMCRAKERSWSVDVHDVTNIKTNDGIASHINHSDLIFLDYHLYKGDEGGEIARPIIKALASNNHFNLVVVHTSGVGGNIRSVFEQILFDLIGPSQTLPNGSDYKAIDKTIEDLDFDEDLIDGINKACDKLKAQELLFKQDPSGLDFKSIFDRFIADLPSSANNRIEPDDIFWWALANKFSEEEFIGNANGVTSFHWGGEEDSNWISTGKLFITVVKKDSAQNVEYLTSKLSNALKNAKPSPLLLMMARMRFELEENGLLEATKISLQSDLQAGWMSQLLNSKIESRHIICRQILDKHWERMSKETHQRLSEYSNEIVGVFQGDAKNSLKQLFGDKLQLREKEIIAELNCYSCSRDISNHHLSTGHVIRLGATPEYWLCLTPACDLVPGQKSKGWYERLHSNNMPFKAVKLIKPKDGNKEAINGANHNNYLWLNIDGNIEAFMYPKAGSVPEWEQMFAKNSGIFNKNHLTISRINSNNGELSISNTEAKVIAELRYEYALNLLHRLGTSLSRVGLDFVNALGAH